MLMVATVFSDKWLNDLTNVSN